MSQNSLRNDRIPQVTWTVVDEEGERKEKGEEDEEGQATFALLTKDTNKVRVTSRRCNCLFVSTIPTPDKGIQLSNLL